MTDIKLLPLPEADDSVEDRAQWPFVTYSDVWLQESVQDYARANMEPLLAEIETLRMEIEGHRIAIQQLYDRAERLTEALREAQKLFEWNAIGGPLRRRIDALLRDHDKEGE